MSMSTWLSSFRNATPALQRALSEQTFHSRNPIPRVTNQNTYDFAARWVERRGAGQTADDAFVAQSQSKNAGGEKGESLSLRVGPSCANLLQKFPTDISERIS